MKDLRPIALLLAFLFSGVIGLFVAASCNSPVPPPQAAVVTGGDPLTEAIKSAVMLNLVDGYGTGVLIGRKKLENGNWQYAILTAYHVIDDVRTGIANNPIMANRYKQMTIAYQETFHGPIIVAHTSIIEFEWMVPSRDWGIFSIELSVKLPCAQLATKEEFEAIQPYDHIYGMGADDADGLFFREGVIGSTNGTQPFMSPFEVEYAWDVNQDDYFRVYQGVFYGASGGPVFSRQGKLLGIYNGFVHRYQNIPVTNFTIVLKGHIVREMLVRSNITTVEK